MTWPLALAVGLVAGAWHLACTAVRARLFVVGSPQPPRLLALLLAPVGIAGPLLAVGLVLRVAATGWAVGCGLWAVLVGLLLARFVLMGPVGRWVEEGTWTR